MDANHRGFLKTSIASTTAVAAGSMATVQSVDIVCADVAGNADNLKIETLVNGEVSQSSNTNDMVFNCAQIVSYASKLFTLEAGDIIFTGTPEGVISGYPKKKQV